ncbi:threonine synthase [Flavobacterium channae]|uniref:threonine synthase n=1 Tax=Flavobacterium channae TaxID=2897181 RepID=UPI001E548783|nr:threonine synthase [Flavobacterium channae]UGS22518.1 threonine synthase [Flavobacterium channae]
MKYFSTNNHNIKVRFKDAVIHGLAPDKGLYFPEEIPQLPQSFFNNIENLSDTEIAYTVLQPFIGDEIPEYALKEIINETLTFDFPVVKITEDLYSLELFHGPTLAFKDVGARFMSRCLGYFNRNSNENVTVLVATSGDTGGAVANGFLGVKGVKVVILYPSKRVSDIQEKQLTTLGGNIFALEVTDTFDTCQAMVKKAFLDSSLQKYNLTSANSINVARWLPQMIYYFVAYKKLKKLQQKVVISCPSGNFGNICAGLLAYKMGLPIEQFIAATNANNTVPRFLETEEYLPSQTVATLSNAMDVSNPSNFVRILELFHQNVPELKSVFSSYSYNDLQTKKAIQELYSKYDYVADPHGAVGYLGTQKATIPNSVKVFLETAHPIKFKDAVEQVIDKELPLPDDISAIIEKEKKSIVIENYEELKESLALIYR